MNNGLEGQLQRQKPTAKPEQGQGLIEYALILVLVAVVSIVVLNAVGGAVTNTFQNITCSLEQRENCLTPARQVAMGPGAGGSNPGGGNPGGGNPGGGNPGGGNPGGGDSGGGNPGGGNPGSGDPGDGTGGDTGGIGSGGGGTGGIGGGGGTGGSGPDGSYNPGTFGTATPSITPTASDTPSPTPAPPTSTATPTPTYTPSNTPTHTPTNMATHTPTYTPSFTPTYTPSHTPTYTPTLVPTAVIEYYINFGASSSMSSGGKTWTVGTATSSGGSISTITTSTSNYSGIKTPPVCTNVVQSRQGNNGRALNYSLSGLPSGTYTITAYFMEADTNTNRQGTFDIYVEGTKVVPSYRPLSQGLRNAHSLSGDFPITDGTLTLSLSPISGAPSICGISIVRK